MTVTLPTAGTAIGLPLVEVILDAGLDSSTLPAVREQLRDVLALRPDQVVVDMSRCTYIGSPGILVLLEAHRTLWRRGGRLVLRGCSVNTLRMLTLAGAGRVFDLEEASGPLRALAPRAAGGTG